MLQVLSKKGVAEILLYGDIGSSLWGEGITSKQFKEAIDKATKDADKVVVRINSGGGNVFDGLAMYHELKRLGKRAETEVDGLAASAASVVALGGWKRRIGEAAFLMIHNPSTMVSGESSTLRATADLLDKVREELVGIYTSKVTESKDKVVAWLDAETWFNATEAVQYGFADSTVAGSVNNGLALPSHFAYRNVPNFKATPAYQKARISQFTKKG